jgi:hypothetical protein
MADRENVEAVARALFARDAKRSIGLAGADYVWPRVADEYRAQARVAVEAARVQGRLDFRDAA